MFPDPDGGLANSPVQDPPRISAEAAARALCELFLANADCGDNAANDHLIAEMVDRIRIQQEQLRPHLVRVFEKTPNGSQ